MNYLHQVGQEGAGELQPFQGVQEVVGEPQDLEVVEVEEEGLQDQHQGVGVVVA